MPFSIATNDPILRARLYDTLTNDDLVSLAKEVEKLEKTFKVVPHRLSDLRPVTRVEITFEGVLALASKRLALKFPNSFKSAIIATELVHFGFARMFATLNDHPQISIAIFPDTAEALEWLALPGQELPKKLWSPRATAV